MAEKPEQDNSGKGLESLIQSIENLLAAEDITVTANRKVFDDNGVQIAEFDVIIEGKIASVDVKILIECRDRKCGGAAPACWIEQLAGRKDRFNFSRVIAVSTSGFAPGAIQFATDKGIELREVKAITAADVANWCQLTDFKTMRRTLDVIHATIIHSEDLDQSVKEAVNDWMKKIQPDSRFLISTRDGEKVSVQEAWLRFLNSHWATIEDKYSTSIPEKVKVNVGYTNPKDRFQIETDCGRVDVIRINFLATVKVEEKLSPIKAIRRYTSNKGDTISETVSFDAELAGVDVEVNLHRIPKGDHSLLGLSLQKKARGLGSGLGK